jgi:hypothetical protein
MVHLGNTLPALKSLFQSDRGPLSVHARPFRFVDLSLKTLFIAFLAIDIGFILLNLIAIVAHHLQLIDAVPEALRITQDGALPEEFNYLKWAVISISLAWLALRDHWLAPLGWALVFAMILADDSLQLHERLGATLSSLPSLPSSAYFFAYDLGEMLAFGAMGLVAFGVATLLFLRSRAAGRALTLRYSAILIVLGCFGVGVDAVHEVVSHMTQGTSLSTVLSQLFGMIEEGGEMVVGSFAVAMTLTTGHLRHGHAVDAPVEA